MSEAFRRYTMTTQAYVFVYATPGKVEESAKAIAKIDGVKSAHACWGRSDVIAFVEVPNPKALGQLVLQKVERAPGVEGTDTRILVEA
jgi:DNA-binding Lrp family transcriptional regulator